MEIKRVVSQASGKGPSEWFRVGTALGRADRGERPGDVVWFPPGEKLIRRRSTDAGGPAGVVMIEFSFE
jgi:hypothetical protein